MIKMQAWLMDAYRADNSIVFWIKTPEENLRLSTRFRMIIYADLKATPFLKAHNIHYFITKRQTYFRYWNTLCAIPVPNIAKFEQFVRWLEQITNYSIPLYDADIPPEQMFLYKHKLTPFSRIEIHNNHMGHLTMESLPLQKLEIKLEGSNHIKSITANSRKFEGAEPELLASFVKEFIFQDPDVILMDYAFSSLPFLVSRLQANNLSFPFNRWDDKLIKYKGGKTFYTYGQVRYQDFGIRLNGRFLVDTKTAVGSSCDVDGIIELSQISGSRFQQTASRSFGAVFQSTLIKLLVHGNFLVPFKEKPIDLPLSMTNLLKSDRAAHTYDPKTGFHTNVAEIDFCSMFPWLIYNHNISADTILKNNKIPYEKVPGIPVNISLRRKGFVPMAIKPFLDKRMEYKKNPTAVNRSRAIGLKWVLVTSYGYLRHREFKLGIATSHMAVCAYARETILKAARLAEEKGFEIIHGIVDSLYIRKKHMSEYEVKDLCKELELITGIPVSFKGIFKWIVIRSSIKDIDRPVPTQYFGVFNNKKIKARGIEVRQKNTPLIVKYFQQKVLETISVLNTKKEIVEKTPILCKTLHKTVHRLKSMDSKWLIHTVCLGTNNYKHNIPQKTIFFALKNKGITIQPGQTVRYVFQENKVVLPEDYNGKPDVDHYKKLLIRSLFVVLQPFGITKEYIIELSACKTQTKLSKYLRKNIIYKHIPNTKSPKPNRALPKNN